MASGNFSIESINQAYCKVQLKYKFTETLKPLQLTALLNLITGRDTLCVLPTGYGKTLIYTLLPLLWDELDDTAKHTVVVVSPLKSLIADQVERVRSKGISVVAYTSSTTQQEIQDIKRGIFSIVLGSPETLLKAVNDLADDMYPSKVAAFIVDEVHNVVDWKTFRPLYTNLAEIKTIVSSKKPWGLFTATCDKELRSALMKTLCITDVATVSVSPDRPNIYLEFRQEKGMKVETSFQPLVEELSQKQENMPKTLVYCRTKEATGEIYAFLMNSLRDKAYLHVEQTAENRFIEQYSASYTGKDEERIVKRILENDTKLRVVITTIALGMGVDMKDIEVVYHWGVSGTVLQYWQKVGRAGRGGKASKAILLAYPLSVPAASDGMKDFIKQLKDGKCIRRSVLEKLKLDEDVREDEIIELCCSSCNKDV